MTDRKLPGLGRLDDLPEGDRIPTLTEIVPPAPPAGARGNAAPAEPAAASEASGGGARFPPPGAYRPPAPAPPAATAAPVTDPPREPAPRAPGSAVLVDDAAIEELTDRVLDAIAPILREQIAVALAALIDDRLGHTE